MLYRCENEFLPKLSALQMNVQIAQQALDMEEAALYLQRQQEIDRDIHVQRFLLQEQLQQEALSNAALSNAAASLHASRLYFGGGLGGGGLAAQLQEQEFLLQHQEQLRRQQLQQQIIAQTKQNGQAAEQLFADSLTANAIRRSSATRKRSFDHSEAEPVPSSKKVARSGYATSEKASKSVSADTGKPKKVRKKQTPSKKQTETALASKKTKSERDETAAIEALTAFGDELVAEKSDFTPTKKGTVESLLSAAEGEEKVDKAAATIASLKETVNITALDDSPVYDADEVIDLPNFKSVLPRLPSEPEYMTECPISIPSVSIQDSNVVSKSPAQSDLTCRATPETKAGALSMTVDYPYPVDTWWPSITTIRKERRSKGSKSDEEDFNDEPALSSEVDLYFRADLQEIQRRLGTELEPGVLEKFPHCRIHRMAMKTQKVANAPDHAFCWQVTENYCNDPMVCCSVCSTWRHARCGGHYKSMTIRETMKTPFVSVCDRCHAEQYILKDFPMAASRLERQRVEQLRRALATSHVIRQSSFAKHGGTYKWPLGSVSNTHIGGHTRSVHSRHDKAEKQWSEMVTRLSQTSGCRPKERIKVRTRELERLLVSIEDSEGMTDRHNMILFLQQDTNKDKPVGYEIERANIFDPEDDLAPLADPSESKDNDAVSVVCDDEGDSDIAMVTDRPSSVRGPSDVQLRAQHLTCASHRCVRKPRFDSIFCSDGCGVCALEVDLMHAFQYANDIHPSLLRS
jgi:hypothetical protein